MTLNSGVNPEEKERQQNKRVGGGYYFKIRIFDVHVPSYKKEKKNIWCTTPSQRR